MIKLTTMNIIEENCNHVIELFDKNNEKYNENVGMTEMSKLLFTYKEKFENTLKINDSTNTNLDETHQKLFRHDTKLVFNVIQEVFANETLLKEFEDDCKDNLDWDENDEKEKNEYINFIVDVQYLLDNIDTTNLNIPDTEFKQRSNKVIKYLQEKNQGMIELNNTVSELGDHLKELSEKLETLITTS